MNCLQNVVRAQRFIGSRRARRATCFLALASVVAVTAAACSSSQNGGSATSNSAHSGLTTVKIETAPGNVLAYVGYLANALGYFKKNNINASFSELTTGQQASAALLSGALNIVYFDPDSGAPLLNSKVPVEVILGEELNTWDLVVSKSFKGQPLEDVARKLKTVGAPSVGGAGAARFRLIANSYDIPSSNYTVVADEGGVGFLSGHEDGVIVSPTATCTLETQGGVDAFSFYHPSQPASSYPSVLASSIKIPANAYWASKSWVSAHPQAVKGLQAALTEAEQWINNPANLDTMVSMIRESNLNPADLTADQLHSCLSTVQGLFQPYFSASDANTWSTIVQKDGTSTVPLPDPSTWILNSVPTGPSS